MAAFESPDTPWGGVAAVFRFLPAALAQVSRQPVYVTTPYHRRLLSRKSPTYKPIGQVAVRFGGESVPTRVLRRSAPTDNVQWIFLEPQTPDIFAGAAHPYDVDPSTLRRDALFFGAAALRALDVLPTRLWSAAYLHDWQAATLALYVASTRDTRLRHTFIHLHSSLDSGPLTDAELVHAGVDPARCRGPIGHADATVLQRALGAEIVAHPIFTVSRQFAADLVEDSLQTHVMADHLQPLLRGRLVGLNNGPFVARSVPEAVVDAASRGDCAGVLTWKNEQRADFLLSLRKTGDTTTRLWGERRRLRGDLPWILMAGRHDPQKGYDIAAAATRRALTRGLDASFVFAVLPGPEGLAGLRDLELLASDLPERVLVIPTRLEAGYSSLVSGATWALMPSRWEPFGMITEFAMRATPSIARGTGGLLELVSGYRAAAAFSDAVRRRSDRWHSASAEPTGILFRESDAVGSAESIVDELCLALEDAVRLVQDQPRRYARMIWAGIEHVERNFSWSNTAAELWRHAERR